MKSNKKQIIIRLFIIICISGFLYSCLNIILWYVDNQKNIKIQEESKKIIDDIEYDEKNTIDFSYLKKTNPDIVGYLKVNNTNIDYIVVKGNDNSYYLKHNLKKESNRAGWIFMDYRNKLDGTDKNIIIYGHNTKDGSMFGTLRNVITNDWYSNKDNYIIEIPLENGINKYQVFSTYSIPVEDYYITTDFEDDKEFQEFVKTLKKRSIYDYKVLVDETDSILTLSTCTGNGTKRMILHAKKIN